MKNLILCAGCLVIFTVDLSRAQLPVSTQPQNKKVLIEHFYGFKCYWSPDGDSIAEAVRLSHVPGRVFVVNIHNFFNYSAPSPGWPAYGTADGAAILALPGMNCTGIPAGPVNRHKWTGFPGMSMDRSFWKKYSDSVVAQPAYVNVALQGTLDVITRIMTVEAEVYYTGNSPAVSNSLHIMLLEDDIVGPQIKPMKYVTNWNSNGTYNHHNVLRKAITPVHGTQIANTSAGSFSAFSFTYTIPAAYGSGSYTTAPYLGSLRLVGFVTESDREVQNVAHGPVTLRNIAYTTDMSVSALQSPSLMCSSLTDVTFNITNNGSTAITSAILSCALNSTNSIQYLWNGNIKPFTRMQTVTIPLLKYNSVYPVNAFEVAVASVNYTADEDVSNSSLLASVLQTPYGTGDLKLRMDFMQDQFGDECRWEIIDEATNQVIQSDGPWSQLQGPGTLLHTKSFTLPAYGCYRLVVKDSKGNGISGSAGNGGYSLASTSKLILGSSGQFGYGHVIPFTAYTLTGLDAPADELQVSLFPNPAAGLASLQMHLGRNETVGLTVRNSLGVEVFRMERMALDAGTQVIPIPTENLANGAYFIAVNTASGTIRKTLLVEK